YLTRSGAQRDPEYLIQVLIEQNITSFTSTPAALQVMLDQPAFIQCKHVKMIAAIGEVLSPAFQDRILSCMPQAQLTNGYGPTEASITVTTWKCERQSTRRSVPIGRPQTNVEIYILDPGLEPVPIGVAGEIHIGGVAVSGGYLNRPELTAERFIPHPFRPESGERVYRTGDIARFDPDGVIEYIGRRDNQLKIRGVRVELGEIEATLDRLPAVKESVVVARDDAAGEKRLIAYVVLNDRAVTPLEIRRALESRLPSQFMPATIIPVDAMPRNTNGKVDRGALRDASSSAPVPRAVNLPQTILQRHLARIWQEMLVTPDIGINDSFFDMGGHSLLAVVMLQRVGEEIGNSVTLRALYAEPTIEAMARSISGNLSPRSTAETPPILKLREGGNGRAPLFYLNGHPPGTGLYVLELPRYLSPEQPIYIVHTPIFDRPVTVEDIATQLLERIRAEVPTGPYMLGGNCLGAWLALEIGRQLIAAGERVPLVIILHAAARAHVHLGFRILRRLSLLAGVPEEFHSGEFASAGEYLTSTTARIWEELRRSTLGERIDGCRKAARWTGSYVRRHAGKPLARLSNPGRAAQKPHACTVPDSRGLSAEEQIEVHRGHWWWAWRRHEPRPYPGRVAILWPTGAPGYPPWNARAGWAHLTTDLDWRVVPGDHVSMMDKHLEETMRELNACIEQAGQQPARALLSE
ncbi:MAG: AMP-binding protein, partial [Gemmatimonadaceae bacterium]